MNRALSEAFARYGMSVSVLRGGEMAETKAFLQLVKRENGEEPFSVTALGAAVSGTGGRCGRNGRLCAVRREAVCRARGGAVLRG